MNQGFPLALSYDDVLLVPQYSELKSRSEVDLSVQISPRLKLKTPLISTKMDTVTGVKMAIAMGKLGGFGILPRFEVTDSQVDKVREVKKANVPVAAAVGIKEGFIKRTEALVNAGAEIINVDVAHGHLQITIDAVSKLREKFGDKITLIAGITSTYECAEALYEAGADSLLVGIGAGATCTTRVKTGCGVPGFTSLLETAKSARKRGKTFMPDAGIRNSGDIVKALAAGASAIVSGFLFAATDEAPGKIVEIKGQTYKEYNGSASLKEKTRQVKIDASDKNKNYIKHVEGVEGLIPVRGPVKNVVENLLTGVRSGFSYCGARTIEDLWQKANFIRVTPHGRIENGFHDIMVIKSSDL